MGEADYLLVTDAERLYASFGADEVDDLLNTMAELAQLKQGLLGYLGGLIPHWEIERMGSGMRGSDDVPIELWVENAGDPADVLVDVTVWSETTGGVADGLLLDTLHGLTGPASYALQWGSTGFPAAVYHVETELRDDQGRLLDRAFRRFRLGILAAEVASLDVSPPAFDIGDRVDISLVLRNTGSLPITGTALIQLQTQAGGVVHASEHPVAGLLAGTSITVEDTWDTTGSARGRYRAVGTLRYGAGATDPVTADLRTRRHLYLPLVLRTAP